MHAGFGTPSKPGGGFGQAAGIGGFGTPAPFGAPATPSASFGTPATPSAGFGTPTAGGFGKKSLKKLYHASIWSRSASLHLKSS